MKRAAFILLAAALLAPLGMAQEQETRYVNNSFARLSHLTGTAFIQRAQDLGYEDAEINSPIAEGDRIGTTEGRLEIYLGKRIYVRLDESSKIDFASLPRRDNAVTRIRQWAGHMYLDVGALAKEKSIEVLTDDATFYVLDSGLYRIDVRPDGGTEIMVFEGMVEAAGADGSMLVKDSQRIMLAKGGFQGKPAAFFAAGSEDAFDRFNSSRLALVRRQSGRGYLPEELSDLEYELDEYGDWQQSPEFGWVWIPRGMGPDWRPYSWGRWTWIPMAGWVWIPGEPWGWGPFHYGRWHWSLGWGWHWIPMGIWGPAWVDWWWGYDYWGWAPLSYWGYPGVLYNNRYWGRGWQGEYPRSSRAITVIRKDQLRAPDIRKVTVNPESLKDVGRITMSGKMPDVRPGSPSRISTEPLKGAGGGVILRQGGDGTADEGASRQGGRVIRETGSSASGGQPAGGRISDNRSGAGPGQADKPTTAKSGEGAAVKKGESQQGQPPAAAGKTSGERQIRRYESAAGSGSSIRSYAPGSGYGYPSSPSITRESAGRGSSGSVLGNIYRRIQSGRSGSSVRSGSSSSGSSSSRSSSRGTVSRGSSSSGSSSRSGGSPRTSSGGSRGSGGSSRSGSSGGSRSSGGGASRHR